MSEEFDPTDGAQEEIDTGVEAESTDDSGEVEKPLSRRAQFAIERQQAKEEAATLRAELAKHREDTARELARRDAEIARIQGGFSALQSQASAPKAPAGPTPEDLEDLAAKALDDGQYSKHRELLRQREKLILDQQAAALREEFRKAQPQQQSATQIQQEIFEAQARVTHKSLGAMESAARGAILQAFDTQFQALPWGPDRWAKTYAAAEAFQAAQSGGKRPASSYSQGTRGALGGAPAANAPTPSDQGNDVQLTPDQRKWASLSGMSEAEYKKHMRG